MAPITSALPFDATQFSSTAQPKDKAKETQNQFLMLLVAQLKGQNPLDPADGTEFVSQLATFSSLEELTKISTSMDSIKQMLAQSAAIAGQTDDSHTNVKN